MSGMLPPILVFLLSNLLFGSVLASFLLRRVGGQAIGPVCTVLLGFGLAPFTISWVLNLVLLLLPGRSHAMAIAPVLLAFGALALAAGSGWRSLWSIMSGTISGLTRHALWPHLFFSAVILFGTAIMITYKPLVDHDILEYGTQGKRFLRDMAVRYERHHYDASTGFYYVGLHGFSFPLLFTWEGLLRGLMNDQGDAWVRLQTPWTAWLTVTFIWAWVRRWDQWLAVWVCGAFTLTLGFLYLNTIYHVDPVRLFLFSASMVLFIAALRQPDEQVLLLWGAVMGAHALTHSLGMVLSPFMLLCFFLSAGGSLSERLRCSLLAAGTFLVAGGYHYLLDMTIGTGWLLKDITWF
jgi:ABC-type multidrug transport system fused ATPase/permease subunit